MRRLVFLALGLAACSDDERASGLTSVVLEEQATVVIVRGTTLDAESGEPLAGVRVVAPDGTAVLSDADGRFEFVGLPELLSGPLTASGDDGRAAENPLRPLQRGVLEVVLRLRAP